MAEERNVRKVRVGKVVSDKMDKTVVVAVERKVLTHYITSQWLAQNASKLMMKIMSVKLAIQLKL